MSGQAIRSFGTCRNTARSRPGHALADSVVVTLAFALTNLPCMFVWAGFGAALREYLTVPSHIRAFNIAMAAALVISILPLLKG